MTPHSQRARYRLANSAIVHPMSTPEQHVELIARVAQTQDRAAFSDLLTHFAPRVKGFLLGKGAAPIQVDEIVQEVMLTVWTRAARFDPKRAQVSTWIFTIARNRWIDRIRKERRPSVDETDPAWVPSAPEAPDTALGAQRDQRRVSAAIAELPEAQAQIIHRSYFLGLAQQQIADDLDLPIGTVKSRTRLALGRLREVLMRDEMPQPGVHP